MEHAALYVGKCYNYWSNYNNTDINPIVTDVLNSAPNDGSIVERKLWLNGDNCVSVQELKVVNGGEAGQGLSNMDINASEEIWNFVSQFNLKDKLVVIILLRVVQMKMH